MTLQDNTQLVKYIDTTSNPAPVGLLGFGMTTVLLNLHNAGFYTLGSIILAMGIFYGGIAQVIAGIMEWKKGNTFGTVAFMSYGFFWLTLVGFLFIPKMGLAAAPEKMALVAYLVLWGIFTTALFIATLKLSRSLQLIFFTLLVLFFLLAFADYSGNSAIKVFAGYEGIVCGLLAMYTGLAQVINEVYKKTVFPI